VNMIPTKTILTNSQIEAWLLENRVIEELFGASIHQELIAKCDVLLVFLAHRRVLTEKHISQIWQSTRGAHEAVNRVLYHLVLLIVPVLEPNLRHFLFGLISSVVPFELTEQLLYLIKNFTIQALVTARDEQNGKSLVKPVTSKSPHEASIILDQFSVPDIPVNPIEVFSVSSTNSLSGKILFGTNFE